MAPLGQLRRPPTAKTHVRRLSGRHRRVGEVRPDLRSIDPQHDFNPQLLGSPCPQARSRFIASWPCFWSRPEARTGRDARPDDDAQYRAVCVRAFWAAARVRRWSGTRTRAKGQNKAERIRQMKPPSRWR
ncbi:hypothetical protein B0H14DRAFT_3480532 [Mycena olivaceomarginata]|nr:hypothetical protein B0H14DRAFT_3480532 [Mycena olivaceomarginata]